MKRGLFLIFGIFYQFFVTQACEVEIMHPQIEANSIEVIWSVENHDECPFTKAKANFSIQVFDGNNVVVDVFKAKKFGDQEKFSNLIPCTEYTIKIIAVSHDEINGTRK